MIGVALLLTLAQVASAQPTAPVREPGSNLTVYLVTMGPGDQVWERFGHNAIWIHDEVNGTDIAYHWGLFDIADKEFIPHFIQGRMQYSMGAFDMEQTIEGYRQANRTVWAQELNLAPAERAKLAEFVAWNILPENRLYSYDYFRDNCSTRVRDALDSSLAGLIRNATNNVQSGTTYRYHTSRLTQDDWPIFTGTMTALGQPTDRPIDVWEEMFLPVRMMDRLRAINVQTPSGVQPLVRNERVLFQATRTPEEATVNRGMIGYLAIALGLLVLGAVLLIAFRNGGGTAALSLATLWSVVAGIAGVLVTFLWGFTDHAATYRNENLLQLNPISLLLAVFLIRLMWKRRRSSGDRDSGRHAALRVAQVVAGVSLIGFVLQVLPGIDQVNGDVIALAMPLHLGVLLLLFVLPNQTRTNA